MIHTLPEQWLRSRARGWMELIESPDLLYWLGTYTPEGKWIYCSSNADAWNPGITLTVYAQDVCRHVNHNCAHGGAWLVGWIRGGNQFYLCWKDADGDIQIPIECDKPPSVLIRTYTVFDWERLCEAAYKAYAEWIKDAELKKDQQVKLAQGQKTSGSFSLH